MIITKIHGGLGNQMFQYAIAKSIAQKRNDIFKLDLSFYPNQTLRRYQLSFFNIEEKIATTNEITNLKNNENIFFKFLIKFNLKWKNKDSHLIEEDFSVFEKKVFDYNDDMYLDGYWQNEKYFLDIKEELKKDFSLKKDISVMARKHLINIKSFNSISIHVRRGDYLFNSHTNNIHGICGMEYYKKSIKYMDTYIKDPFYFIFSDDIDWCKKNFNFIKNKKFIDDTKDEFDDLELMKNCKHNIIANSSFSWWSAWLNQHLNKIVIAPKQWFANVKMQNISKELIPEQWIKI